MVLKFVGLMDGPEQLEHPSTSALFSPASSSAETSLPRFQSRISVQKALVEAPLTRANMKSGLVSQASWSFILDVADKSNCI